MKKPFKKTGAVQNSGFIKDFAHRATKISNQRHLSALRDTFMLLLPIIVAATFSMLVVTVIFGTEPIFGVYSQDTPTDLVSVSKSSLLGLIANWSGVVAGNASDSPVWYFSSNGDSFIEAQRIGREIFSTLAVAGLGLISLYVSFGLGYYLAKTRKFETPIIAGFVSLLSFLICTNPLADGITWFGSSGLFVALVIGFGATELFLWFSKQKWMYLRLPAGVPPSISRSFARLFPIIFTSLVVGVFNWIWWISFTYGKVTPVAENWSFASALARSILAPFKELVGSGDGLWVALVLVLAINFLWILGVDGYALLVPVYLAIFPLDVANDLAFSTLPSFIFLGGTGATIGLLLATFIFSRKRGPQLRIAKMSIVPGVFNTNEPLRYGAPLVLNPYLALPVLITAPILTCLTWLFIGPLDFVPQLTVVIPPNVPIFVGALIASNFAWQSAILVLINLLVATIIYFPFVWLWLRHDRLQVLAYTQPATAPESAPTGRPVPTTTVTPQVTAPESVPDPSAKTDESVAQAVEEDQKEETLPVGSEDSEQAAEVAKTTVPSTSETGPEPAVPENAPVPATVQEQPELFVPPAPTNDLDVAKDEPTEEKVNGEETPKTASEETSDTAAAPGLIPKSTVTEQVPAPASDLDPTTDDSVEKKTSKEESPKPPVASAPESTPEPTVTEEAPAATSDTTEQAPVEEKISAEETPQADSEELPKPPVVPAPESTPEPTVTKEASDLDSDLSTTTDEPVEEKISKGETPKADLEQPAQPPVAPPPEAIQKPAPVPKPVKTTTPKPASSPNGVVKSAISSNIAPENSKLKIPKEEATVLFRRKKSKTTAPKAAVKKAAPKRGTTKPKTATAKVTPKRKPKTTDSTAKGALHIMHRGTKWIVKREGAKRSLKILATQKEAIDYVRQQHDAERVVVHNKKNRIRKK